jgi:hypothetical protein
MGGYRKYDLVLVVLEMIAKIACPFDFSQMFISYF